MKTEKIVHDIVALLSKWGIKVTKNIKIRNGFVVFKLDDDSDGYTIISSIVLDKLSELLQAHEGRLNFSISRGKEPTVRLLIHGLAHFDSFKDYEIVPEVIPSEVKIITIEGIDTKDAPDFCDAYILEAEQNGVELTDSQIDELNKDSQFVYEKAIERIY